MDITISMSSKYLISVNNMMDMSIMITLTMAKKKDLWHLLQSEISTEILFGHTQGICGLPDRAVCDLGIAEVS